MKKSGIFVTIGINCTDKPEFEQALCLLLVNLVVLGGWIMDDNDYGVWGLYIHQRTVSNISSLSLPPSLPPIM